jgi:prepilin-type N-terminal cleavage/methylation domain-containing protein
MPHHIVSCLARPRRFGFTLIELLVVVSIIGVLVALLLPAMGGARDNAQTVKCKAQLRAMYVATMNYGNDFSQYYPIRSYEGVAATTDAGYKAGDMNFAPYAALEPGLWYSYRNYMSLLMPYFGDGRGFVCPAAACKFWGYTYCYSAGLSMTVHADGSLVQNWWRTVAQGPLQARIGQEGWPPDTKILYGDGWAGVANTANQYRTTLFYAGAQNAVHPQKGALYVNVILMDGSLRTLPGTHPAFLDPGQTAFYLMYATGPTVLPLN